MNDLDRIIPNVSERHSANSSPADGAASGDSEQRTVQAPISAVPRPTAGASAPNPPVIHGTSTPSVTQKSSRREFAEDASVNEPQGKKPRRQRGPRRFSTGQRVGIGLAIVAGIAVVGYAAGVFAFSNIFYPNTHIVGIDVSLMTADTAKARVEASAVNYKLAVSGEGFDWTYKPAQGVNVSDAEERVKAVISANDAIAWPAHLVEALRGTYKPAVDNASSAELPADFDQEAFDADLSAAVDAFNQNRTGVFDAASSYSEDTGTFTYEKANENRKINKEKLAELAKSAIAGLESTATVTEDQFDALAGDHTDDQIKAACDAANALIGTNCTIDMAGNNVATLDGKMLASFISFDENLNPSISGDGVTQWANDLASQLNTVGSTRTYTRPDGKTITIDGGTFGWTVDTDALVAAVQDAVANKRTDPIDVPTSSTANVFTKAGEKDWTAYVDVDLTEQHARYYDENGNLAWESGCITGKPYGGDDTPTGVWKVNSVSKKGVSTTLRGPKKKLADGEQLAEGESAYEWESPVDVWIPFIRNSYGLHDATWQRAANFSNPDAYKTVGSHGCVNLPLDKAQELRDLLDGKTGTAVIVHW